MKSIVLIGLAVFSILNQGVTTKQATDREHDGFSGPVKSVVVEWSPIYMSYGRVPVGSKCRQNTDVYDKNGRLMLHSVYSGECGSDEIRSEYSYARDGSRTEKMLTIRGRNSPPSPPGIAGDPLGPEDTGEPRTIFKYGPSGQLIEEASVRPSGKVIDKYIHKYDTKGRMIETAGYEDGQVSVRRVYSYEGDNRVPSGFIYYGSNGKVYERTTYTDYEFNSRGDWVKRKQTTEETLNRKSISWMLRKLEYHPL